MDQSNSSTSQNADAHHSPQVQIQKGRCRRGETSLQLRLLTKAAIGGGASIGAILLGLTTLASFITNLLELPSRLGLAPVFGLAGWTLVIAGSALALWLFRYRSPTTMIVSTYSTFVKMFSMSPISDPGDRFEPLIVEGPQRFVRSPLYLGATTMFLGWSLVIDSTASLISSALILAWFGLVQIPFEERELYAIFGEEWVRYSQEVPMLIPFSRRPRDRALPT